MKAKRLRIDLAEINRMIQDGELKELKWVPSKEQLADVLTKQDAKNGLLSVAECGDFNFSKYVHK